MNALHSIHPAHAMTLTEFSAYYAKRKPRTIIYNTLDDPHRFNPLTVSQPKICMHFSTVHITPALRSLHLKGQQCEMSFYDVAEIVVVNKSEVYTVLQVRCSFNGSVAVHKLLLL